MYWIQGVFDWTPEQHRTPHGLLTFLDSLGGYVLGFGVFVAAAFQVWRRYGCFDNSSTRAATSAACVWNALLACTLVLLLGVVFFLSRQSVQAELRIAEGVFPIGRMPDEWRRASDPIWITVSVVSFFLLYLTMAWFAQDIRVVSAVMTVIAAIDLNTRRAIGKRVRSYFSDPRYTPEVADRQGKTIALRRDVVRHFLYDHRHLWKEGGRLAGCAISCGAAAAGQVERIAWLISLAYIVLIGTLVTNEVVTLRWRLERDRDWTAIEA